MDFVWVIRNQCVSMLVTALSDMPAIYVTMPLPPSSVIATQLRFPPSESFLNVALVLALFLERSLRVSWLTGLNTM
jgi:hypothetical protein